MKYDTSHIHIMLYTIYIYIYIYNMLYRVYWLFLLHFGWLKAVLAMPAAARRLDSTRPTSNLLHFYGALDGPKYFPLTYSRPQVGMMYRLGALGPWGMARQHLAAPAACRTTTSKLQSPPDLRRKLRTKP